MSNVADDAIPYRFTAEDFDRMIAAGLFADDQHVELLEGELFMVPPMDPEHAEVNSRLDGVLHRAYPDAVVRIAMPLDCGSPSRPEPDAAVVPDDRAFFKAHPTAAQTLLIVEVARTSHARDHRKGGIYARAGAPVYWLLDVPGRRLEVHTEPGSGGYGLITILDEHHAATLPTTAVAVRVADLLP